mmetsp:Transcript_16723/g.33437  ORF Transcript_16723/g.33437 Transcript_16723/m.33437 type:complete len:223 (+) Transcript_16723:747-1415(+)
MLPLICSVGLGDVAFDISITIVGLNLFPCLCAKKCFAASERMGWSVSTTDLMLSANGESSSRTSPNGSSGHLSGKPDFSPHGSSLGVLSGTGGSTIRDRCSGRPGNAPLDPEASNGFCKSPTTCAFSRSNNCSPTFPVTPSTTAHRSSDRLDDDLPCFKVCMTCVCAESVCDCRSENRPGWAGMNATALPITIHNADIDNMLLGEYIVLKITFARLIRIQIQ